MWTLKKLKQFLRDNPINTNGAMGSYKHSKIKRRDDGDVYYRIDFPIWSQNDSVVQSLLKLALKASEEGDCYITFHDSKKNRFKGKMRILFTEHACVGD